MASSLMFSAARNASAYLRCRTKDARPGDGHLVVLVRLRRQRSQHFQTFLREAKIALLLNREFRFQFPKREILGSILSARSIVRIAAS